MKMCVGLLLLTALQVSARGYSQTVSISEKNVSLEKVFKLIEKQSGYVFFCDYTLLKQTKPVSVDVKNGTLETVLESCFKDQPVTYSIVGKNIVVKQRELHLKKNDAYLVEAGAAPVTITGQVLDNEGKPADGVMVVVKGNTAKRTITNANGKFAFTGIDADAVLIFSSINFETYELALSGKTNVVVILKASVNSLGELAVVNTGYQTVTKERSTGSVVTITSKDLEKRYNPNLLDQMEGRAPGLVTYATGLNGTSLNSAVRSVTIRGVSTLQNGIGALMVVDGLPIEGSITDINPYDVESINILKDAAAASLYGARAANGVIVITTKKAKSNRTVVDAAADFTLYQKPDYGYLQYMTATEQVDFENKYNAYYFANTSTAASNMNSYINAYNYPVSPVSYLYYQKQLGNITEAQMNNSIDSLKSYNFVQQYKDNALVNQLLQQYNLAIRTNGGRYQSSLVLNYKTNNKGIINANTNSLNIFYKGNYNVTRWLDVDFGVNTVYTTDKSQFDTRATTPLNVPAYQQLVDANGNHTQYYPEVSAYNKFTDTATGIAKMNFNHLDELGRDFTTTKALNSRLYVHVNAKITKDLKFASQFQYEDLRSDISTLSEQESYTMRSIKNSLTVSAAPLVYPYTFYLPATGGRLAVNTARAGNYSFRNQFDFSRTFNHKHNVTAIAGFEFRQTKVRTQGALYLGYDDRLLTNQNNAINWVSLAQVTSASFSSVGYFLSPYNTYTTYIGPANMAVTEVMHRNSSGYANATYTYDGRYNVFASVRKDVADFFGADANLKGRPFYAVGAGWNIHNEAFMKPVAMVSFLKLRASYGLTGNTDFSTTKYATATASRNTVTSLSWLLVSSPSNPNLGWELTHTTNLGLDFGLWNSRLTGSLDVYHKLSTNLIAKKMLDASEGYTSVGINNGQVLNKGIELSVNYAWLKPTSLGALGIITAATLGYNSNKISKADNIYNSNAPALATPSNGRPYQNGNPVNALYSYKYNGINKTGLPEWTLADGTTTTGYISNAGDLVYSGTVDPKLSMSFTPEVTYKRFTLSALFVYYGGHKMRADQPVTASGYSGTGPSGYAALPKYLLNTWTPDNAGALTPGILQYFPSTVYTTSYYGLQIAMSDKFVQPADFIKMRTAALSYQLPVAWANKIAANTIRLRFQVQNAWTVWTQNKIGIDPEANDAYQGNYGGGRSLPVQASFIFGASVNF